MERQVIQSGSSYLTQIIIPGLPNEVALMILVRLPRALHGIMRCVCSAWRDALQPSAVSALRNSLHISEMWALFLFQDSSIAFYDPQFLCSPILHRCHPGRVDCNVKVLGVVGSQVLFWHMQYDVPGFDILCFDAVSMQWQAMGSPLDGESTCYGFASAVVDGYVYVVGGGEDGEVVWRFDVQSRTWEMMPSMHEGHFKATAVVLQGHLHVIGGYKRSDPQSEVQCSEVWDPRTGEWMLQPKLWPAQFSRFIQSVHPLNVAVVMDTLYALQGWELFCYKSESKLWTSLGCLDVLPSWAVRNFQLVGAGGELWLVVNCQRQNLQHKGDCTYKLFSCMPTDRDGEPLSWRSVPINSSIKLGYQAKLYTVYV